MRITKGNICNSQGVHKRKTVHVQPGDIIYISEGTHYLDRDEKRRICIDDRLFVFIKMLSCLDHNSITLLCASFTGEMCKVLINFRNSSSGIMPLELLEALVSGDLSYRDSELVRENRICYSFESHIEKLNSNTQYYLPFLLFGSLIILRKPEVIYDLNSFFSISFVIPQPRERHAQ